MTTPRPLLPPACRPSCTLHATGGDGSAPGTGRLLEVPTQTCAWTLLTGVTRVPYRDPPLPPQCMYPLPTPAPTSCRGEGPRVSQPVPARPLGQARLGQGCAHHRESGAPPGSSPAPPSPCPNPLPSPPHSQLQGRLCSIAGLPQPLSPRSYVFCLIYRISVLLQNEK